MLIGHNVSSRNVDTCFRLTLRSAHFGNSHVRAVVTWILQSRLYEMIIIEIKCHFMIASTFVMYKQNIIFQNIKNEGPLCKLMLNLNPGLELRKPVTILRQSVRKVTNTQCRVQKGARGRAEFVSFFVSRGFENISKNFLYSSWKNWVLYVIIGFST